MTTNANLHKAKNTKYDEFYTQLKDIEKELIHYKKHFKDKIVYCNFDNPNKSAFWEYFHKNFTTLGLKRLIATYRDVVNVPYVAIYVGGDDENIAAYDKIAIQDGDFRSNSCSTLLSCADIVVTNPAFSLFRELVDLLMQKNKKFILLGSQNSLTNKNIFSYVMKNQLWTGVNCGNMWFKVPDSFPPRQNRYRMDGGGRSGAVSVISVGTPI